MVLFEYCKVSGFRDKSIESLSIRLNQFNNFLKMGSSKNGVIKMGSSLLLTLSNFEQGSTIDLTHFLLNKYEGGLHTPPMEKLIQLSEILDTTVDYLLTGNRSDERPLHNMRLLERFKALEEFDAENQETVIKVIDAMIVKKQVEGVVKPHLTDK